MITAVEPIWSWQWIKAHPFGFVGILLHLLLRTLFGVFWLAAGLNKLNKDWLTTNILERIFLDRLGEIRPDAFAAKFLLEVGVPYYEILAYLVTIGELFVAAGLLLGFMTRFAAFVSFIILAGFAVGGYYDASLIPFFLLTLLFISKPSGMWFGLDRLLSNNRYN